MADDARAELISIVREKGYERRDEPYQLRSGEMSHDFVDGKKALADGTDLKKACEVLIGAVADEGIEFDAIGGLTMGADQFAHGVAVLAAKRWFVVRKEPKGRGTNRLVEGASLDPGVRVLLVEDVVTTGGSILQAYDTITELGAAVVGAVSLVDRGDYAAGQFQMRGVPYVALVTYADLGIAPIDGGLVGA